MISEKEIAALLSRISESDLLGQSSVYTRLLNILVDGTLKGNVPKEKEIAAELFGKKSLDEDTSKVRVYIYHLRKKLSSFFEKDGLEEPYVITIPKGGYKVEFSKRQKKAGRLLRATRNSNLYSLLLMSALMGSFLSYLFLSTKVNSEVISEFSNSAIWSSYFTDEKPILIIVGDLLVFSERDQMTGESSIVRNPNLNTLEQFELYRQEDQYQNREIDMVTYTHLPKSSIEWVDQLSKVFYPKNDYKLRVRSNVSTKDLHDYNIIFVGMQKTAGLLNSYFERSKISYDISKTDEYELDSPKGPIRYAATGNPDSEHTDYGLIAKYPGPNNNTIMMFCGLWDSAVSEALRSYAVKSKLSGAESEITSTLEHVPDFFEVLIEVRGVDRIGFESDIIYLREIKN